MATSAARSILAATAPGSAQPERGIGAGSKIVIGSGVQVTGTIGRCASISVQGELKSEGVNCEALNIAPEGHFAGSATVAIAEIQGTFQGRLIAGVLTIQSSAKVDADIEYGELQIERGATVSGALHPRR